MKDKNLFELGKLAQQGNDMAMLEIIERKKKMIKKGKQFAKKMGML